MILFDCFAGIWNGQLLIMSGWVLVGGTQGRIEPNDLLDLELEDNPYPFAKFDGN